MFDRHHSGPPQVTHTQSHTVKLIKVADVPVSKVCLGGSCLHSWINKEANILQLIRQCPSSLNKWPYW